MEMFSSMTPTSRIPDDRQDPDQSLRSGDGSDAVDEAERVEMSTDNPAAPESPGSLPGGEFAMPESDLVDLPDDDLTAEERLLDSIVSDPRAAGEADEAAGACDEAGSVEPSVAPPPPTGCTVASDGSLEEIRRLEDECRSIRETLARVTADRDDLSGRLDLAAVEFERLNQDIDTSESARGRLQGAWEAAQAALLETQTALSETQAQAVRAREDGDAARGRLEEIEAAGQREQDHWRATLREMQADLDRATQRHGRLVWAGAIAIALVAAGGGYGLGRSSHPLPVGGKNMAVAEPALSRPAVAAPVRAVPTNAVRLAGAKAMPPVWPMIRDACISVREEPEALVIRFNDPLFARAVEMAPASRQDLRRVAGLLKPYAAAYRVEVEGHADPSPVGSRVSYASNHELGLMRARAALEVLAKDGGLPLSALSISSAGDTNPPFPGDSPDARRRCRTVVLKLHRSKSPVSQP